VVYKVHHAIQCTKYNQVSLMTALALVNLSNGFRFSDCNASLLYKTLWTRLPVGSVIISDSDSCNNGDLFHRAFYLVYV
jgi:hypothetical protein